MAFRTKNPYLWIMSAPPFRETPTGLDGFRLWSGALDEAAQRDLLDLILTAEQQAPFYQPLTPAGRPFSVMMTNMGPLGWVSDRQGYRYQSHHPVTKQAWPAIPPRLIELWHSLTGHRDAPDACLVNLYRGTARMGLHQDRDEKDLTAPVLSISLGDTALFRLGPAEGGPTRSLKLASGDICALTGPARLARHGVDRLLPGSSRLIPGGGRINLTLRKAL